MDCLLFLLIGANVLYLNWYLILLQVLGGVWGCRFKAHWLHVLHNYKFFFFFADWNLL